ncbi:MAG: cytochrome c3 family protein [Coriobacteriales bacterium]|nr:cytochrome c3 family protein [Coriobacteriales bacterium]
MRLKTIVLLLFVGLLFALAACAPRLASEVASDDTDNSVQAAALAAWTEDSDCAGCHTTEMQSGEDGACTYSLHTATVCITCHTDTDDKLAETHEDYATAKQPTRLKKTEVDVLVCESCHDTGELKEITASSTVLTDANNTVLNPHDLPTTENHLSSIDCASCHKMHKPDPVAETASKVCLSCHHLNVYECGTCH